MITCANSSPLGPFHHCLDAGRLGNWLELPDLALIVELGPILEFAVLLGLDKVVHDYIIKFRFACQRIQCLLKLAHSISMFLVNVFYFAYFELNTLNLHIKLELFTFCTLQFVVQFFQLSRFHIDLLL